MVLGMERHTDGKHAKLWRVWISRCMNHITVEGSRCKYCILLVQVTALPAVTTSPQIAMCKQYASRCIVLCCSLPCQPQSKGVAFPCPSGMQLAHQEQGKTTTAVIHNATILLSAKRPPHSHHNVHNLERPRPSK